MFAAAFAERSKTLDEVRVPLTSGLLLHSNHRRSISLGDKEKRWARSAYHRWVVDCTAAFARQYFELAMRGSHSKLSERGVFTRETLLKS